MVKLFPSVGHWILHESMYLHSVKSATIYSLLINPTNLVVLGLIRFLTHEFQAVLETSSNFLDMEQMDSWNDLPSPMQSEAATRMVSNIERSAFHAVKNVEKPQVVVDVKINIGS